MCLTNGSDRATISSAFQIHMDIEIPHWDYGIEKKVIFNFILHITFKDRLLTYIYNC